MHKDLEMAFQEVVRLLKEDTRCKGGWHYGSVSRGTTDIYSDYDPVFLVADKDFEQFSKDVPMDLLLSQYDTLDWGSWESKIKHCVPEEKQQHLKSYFARAEFSDLEDAVKKSMALFRMDAEEVCKAKGIVYPNAIVEQVVSYFNKRMDTDDWN